MFARIIVCALLPVAAFAYPALWRAEKAATACNSHPTTKEHLHGAPEADTVTKFVVRDAKGAAVKALCPGQTYTVAVAFPEARLSLTTSTMGTIKAQTGQGADNTCPNRVVVDQDSIAALNAFTWEIPCFPSTKTGTLRVTSAAGEKFPFQSANASFPIDNVCSAAICDKGTASTTKVAASKPNGAAAAAVGAASLLFAGLGALVL